MEYAVAINSENNGRFNTDEVNWMISVETV